MVSVVIPNFNKSQFICHSLDSLLRQTCPDWEAIIVDDCSTDDSWCIIQEYVMRDKRFSAVRNEVNRGGCYSRNRGAKMAKGKYLIFLDSDDWLADDCLAHRIATFQKVENCSHDMLVFPMGTVCNGAQTGIWRCHYPQKAETGFLRHELGRCWSIMMPIWRKDAFARIGGFDESFPRLQDVELHTRALLAGLKYKLADCTEPDCFYFVEETRITTDQTTALERTTKGMLMFVEKMRKLVTTPAQRKSLNETYMAAIRAVGDTYQAQKIDKHVRDRLVQSILDSAQSWWISCYALLYRYNVNKLKGVNMLYRNLYRVLEP